MSLRIIEAPSPNFNERRHPLDMLVLHYTGMKDGPSALARLRDPAAEVSAHYMVEEDGGVFALVPEDKRAWHAGRGMWRGRDDINSRSIGIEIVNGGHDFGLPPYPDIQIEAVIELCAGILARWPVAQTNIVAHSDIAPDRKEDPGEHFPWRRLAQAGIGLWPDAANPAGDAAPLCEGEIGEKVETLQGDLAAIGYAIAVDGRYSPQMSAAVRAFQRRWRSDTITGEADSETLARISAIARLSR